MKFRFDEIHQEFLDVKVACHWDALAFIYTLPLSLSIIYKPKHLFDRFITVVLSSFSSSRLKYGFYICSRNVDYTFSPLLPLRDMSNILIFFIHFSRRGVFLQIQMRDRLLMWRRAYMLYEKGKRFFFHRFLFNFSVCESGMDHENEIVTKVINEPDEILWCINLSKRPLSLRSEHKKEKSADMKRERDVYSWAT